MGLSKFLFAFSACAGLTLMPGQAAADLTPFSTVQLVGCSQSSNTCYVKIDGVIPNPAGCATASQARWLASNPVGEEFLSLAMSAFAAGKEVSFYVYHDACVADQPSIAYFNVR